MSYIDPRAKLFQHLDRLHSIQQGGRPAPVNVEIDLSNRCSLGCSWCHFAYTHTRGPLAGKRDKPQDAIAGGDLMDYAFAKEILRQLSDAGVKSVTWTGGGEPTLHPQFDEIVEYAQGVGLEQGLYTHGGHIDEERAEILKDTFTWVFVSLDECDAESYLLSKGVNRYANALDGIRLLVTAQGKAAIGIGFLLHPHNFHRVPRMVALGRELGATYVQFRPTIQFAQATPSVLVEDTNWVNWAIGRLREYEHDPFVIADVSRFEMYRDWQGHGYPTCNWSALQTVITPNGKMWRCTNKREHPDALLGDLTVDNFETIWQRSGGSCAVDGACRILCRGHIANLTLDKVMTAMPHAEFI